MSDVYTSFATPKALSFYSVSYTENLLRVSPGNLLEPLLLAQICFVHSMWLSPGAYPVFVTGIECKINPCYCLAM